MEDIKISKRPKLNSPYLIVAWPGMGEVAFRAATYLVQQLKAEEFAQIQPENFFYPTGSAIKSGVLNTPPLPQSRFYFWKNPQQRAEKSAKHDLIIFISDAQPDLAMAEVYSQKIIQFAKSMRVEAVVGFASMPLPIEHTHEPGVWFTSSRADLNNSLKKYNLNLLSEGQISGMNGLFLGIAKREGLKGFCLLGEIPLYTIQIENPRASQAVLAALGRILDIRIDFSGLIEQARRMDDEIGKLLDYLKVGSGPHQLPINEEEIEKIKKTLGQLTKLPSSMKEKIEKLFEEAKTDITKAGILKTELDKWNVYTDYEDRFLDLFRKKKDKDN